MNSYDHVFEIDWLSSLRENTLNNLIRTIMVKHIVLFKLKNELSAEVRMEVMNTFKQGIEALVGRIDVIRSIEVGFNCNTDETWHICLNSAFDDIDAVRTYAAHPLHQAVAGALKPYVEARSCVDYEV